MAGEVVTSVSSKDLGADKCEIQFSVKDEGIGIKDSAKNQVFEPFTQADQSTTRRYGGTGLGLATSKKLAELMGGKMWFESQEHVGSTFYFTIVTQKIPQDHALQEALSEFKHRRFDRSNLPRSTGTLKLESSSALTHAPTKQILVAEDNFMTSKIISKMLDSLGYKNILMVENGKMAVEAVKAKKFDMVLMDVMMPEVGGLEATETIRRELSKEQQPIIIALTANAFAEDRVRCYQSGMNAVVTKPIVRDELKRVLESFNSVQGP